LENIRGLVGRDNVEFIQGSVTDLALLQRLFRGVEYVFHQAALASVPGSVEDPLATSEINIGGTLKVLLAARDNKVKKVIYASSSSVYGDTSAMPQKEDMPLNPISPYALTKLTGEHYCHIFRQMYGLATVCLRYFNIYGPRQSSQYAAVIPAFIQRACQGLPPVIFGDGAQSRDFVFVKDVVQANILAAESGAEGAYNIGSGRSITIRELAESILRVMGKNLTLVYEEPRSGELKHSLADITKARGFGYQPRWTLEDGLAETIAYFSEERNSP
jgi:UDP-glucose 4-epimerase